jgi:hypothetical protein
MEAQVTVFISSRNRVAQLYPEALGSLFVAFYDSQGYGGGIRPRLHTGSYVDFHRAKKIRVFIFTAARTLFKHATHCSKEVSTYPVFKYLWYT